MYQSRQAFNIHPTAVQCEQDPFPDHIKAMRFILPSKFLHLHNTRQAVEKYGSSGSVSISNVDAYASGKNKVEDHLKRKLFSLFGVLKKREGIPII